MNWMSSSWPNDPVRYNIYEARENPSPTSSVSRDGMEFIFSSKTPNSAPSGNNSILSYLRYTNLESNSTNISCYVYISRRSAQENVTTCVTGPSSAPTDLSVVWDAPHAIVSFQSPVYGGECVEHYTVTAISEEENITCDMKESDMTSICTINSAINISDLTFIVQPYSKGFDGYTNGTVAECSFPIAGVVNAVKKECGLQQLVSISWEETSWNGTLSVNGEIIRTFDTSYILSMDYNMSGPVDISIAFSSSACVTSTTTHYYPEREILKNVSVSYPTMHIESRDCIASPEEYSIVAVYTDSLSNELVNISFNTTIEHYVGDIVRPNTQYTIRVQVVHISSNTIIDEMIETFIFFSPSTTSPYTTPNPDVTATSTTAEDLTTVLVTVCILVTFLMVILTAVVTFLAIMFNKRRNKSNKHNSEAGGVELKMLRQLSQSSVDPTTSSSPPTNTYYPQYEDIDKLRKKKVQPADRYLPLEVSNQPSDLLPKNDDKGTTVSVPVPVPIYSVVDKSKKKRNRGKTTSENLSATNPQIVGDATEMTLVEVDDLPLDSPPDLPPRMEDIDLEMKYDHLTSLGLERSSTESPDSSDKTKEQNMEPQNDDKNPTQHVQQATDSSPDILSRTENHDHLTTEVQPAQLQDLL